MNVYYANMATQGPCEPQDDREGAENHRLVKSTKNKLFFVKEGEGGLHRPSILAIHLLSCSSTFANIMIKSCKNDKMSSH